MKKAIIILFLLISTGCTSMKVVEVNSETGHFPGASKAASVLKSKSIDLDTKKSLLLIPDDEFTIEMVKNINYFDKIMTFEDLENEIIQKDLGDKVPNIDSKIGLNNAAKHYKEFLWLRFDTRQDGKGSYRQMILTNPVNMEDYFVTETYLDYLWTGVNDQHNWYPMLNALIDYINKNSKSRN